MIICAGENLIDMIQTDTPAQGVPEFRALIGGSPYNCARALARLGGPVGYLTPISTDRMGDLLAAGLEGDGVAILGGRSDRPSSLALVALENGQPRYQFYREGVADRDVTSEALVAALPEDAQALQLGSIALIAGADADALASLAETARARGMLVSLDPNIRPGLIGAEATAYRARLERLFAAADLIKLSDEDLDWWAPGQEAEAAAQALFDRVRPTLLILTRGAQGAIAFTAAGRIDLPAAPLARVADTVGAGDTFMAATLDGLRQEAALARDALAALPADRLRALMARAARAAAITCSRSGCNPPTRAELAG